MNKIAVIGAGAAGMTAAHFALQQGAHVTVFEKNKQPGRKICITGKGRCNLTNLVDAREFLTNVVRGKKFLSSAIYRFSPEETVAWFEKLGLGLKVERGRRVFPQSERASDVRDALVDGLKNQPNCSFVYSPVSAVYKCENRLIVRDFLDREHAFDCVIIATGGCTYPLTGSTGDGYKFAKSFGHSVTELSPSLVRIVCADECCRMAQGLSLKNVRLSLFEEGVKKPLYSEQGELLFTDDGVSGPLVLSASAHAQGRTGALRLTIDFKPALTSEELHARLLREFSEQLNRSFKNALDHLLPSVMRPIFVKLSGIAPELKVHQITRAQRENLVRLFKAFPLEFLRLGPMKEAVVTAGGVALDEVDPHTMQSRIVAGLYFAGEVLDVDAYTGGFNLQIAFSTGKLAGESAAGFRTGEEL